MQKHFYRAAIATLISTSAITPVAHADGIARTRSTAATASVSASAFTRLKQEFLVALWKQDPDMAMAARKYTDAAKLTLPDQATRDQYLKFIDRWLTHLLIVSSETLSVNDQTDLVLMRQYLEGTRWYLTQFREFEWNPTQHNIAGDYDAFLTETAKHLTPDTARSFRIGKERYEGKFKADIQSPFTAEQTYQRALAAKDEAHRNMEKLADQLWSKTMGDQPKPDDRVQKIAMVIAKLSEQHIKGEELFPAIRQQLPVLEKWIKDHDLLELDSKKPLIVRETPEYERGVTIASIEAPGIFRPHDNTYFNVTPFDGQSAEKIESTLREYNRWVLQILCIHEAIPGHYTQLQHANQSPSVIKTLFGNGAMIEGWAVYSERMMLESGYGENSPEMWLMYYKWNLRAVCNTILDYSVHVLRMTEVQAKDFLINHAFQTQAEADGKWQRVQYSSVQLASYFSGFSEILDLREELKKQQGDKFKLKQFHEQFLGYGSAPVGMIKTLMLNGSGVK